MPSYCDRDYLFRHRREKRRRSKEKKWGGGGQSRVRQGLLDHRGREGKKGEEEKEEGEGTISLVCPWFFSSSGLVRSKKEEEEEEEEEESGWWWAPPPPPPPRPPPRCLPLSAAAAIDGCLQTIERDARGGEKSRDGRRGERLLYFMGE